MFMWTLDDVPARVPEINRLAWFKNVKELSEKAVPGNWAWRKVEELVGEADYVYGQDEGMHWSDNE